MKLVRFSVERFRSIIKKSSFSVFDKTVLIGPNNEGKSNILLALVCALRTLEAIARDPEGVSLRQGKTFAFDADPEAHLYNWKRDYPRSLQTVPGEMKNKKSRFTIVFELNNVEFRSFKKLTGTQLSNPFIPLRMEFSPSDIIFTLNIPGHFYKKATEEKMIHIAQFVVEKIFISYIPAIRTVSAAYGSIGSLLQSKTRQLEKSDEYKKFKRKMEESYKIRLEEISKQVQASLKIFLSKDIFTEISFQRRPFFISDHSMRFNVEVDDGEKTLLEQKGSGIQSLIALFLAQQLSRLSSSSDNLILAIDEPEAHLHPDAIHKIRRILDDISSKNQLIIATHSPLLAETTDPHKNIIVKENTACESPTIGNVRDVLGVVISDNLSSAEYILIVEGPSDENILLHLLKKHSTFLQKVLSERRLIVSSCGGTRKMEQNIRFIRNQISRLHVVVDNDEPGRQEISNLLSNSMLSESEYTILTMNGLSNSEIENMIDPTVYAQKISSKYGIHKQDILDVAKGKARWSDYMKKVFVKAGKRWNKEVEFKLKTLVSESIKRTHNTPLLSQYTGSFNALCEYLEKQLIKSE